MEQQKQTIIDQFLNKSLDYLNSAEAFIKSEVPAFINEFLAWQFYQAILYLVFCIVVLIIAAVLFYKFKKAKANLASHVSEEGYNAGMTGCVVVGCIFSLFVLGNIETIIKVKTAPRVLLIEELRELTK